MGVIPRKRGKNEELPVRPVVLAVIVVVVVGARKVGAHHHHQPVGDTVAFSLVPEVVHTVSELGHTLPLLKIMVIVGIESTLGQVRTDGHADLERDDGQLSLPLDVGKTVVMVRNLVREFSQPFRGFGLQSY